MSRGNALSRARCEARRSDGRRTRLTSSGLHDEIPNTYMFEIIVKCADRDWFPVLICAVFTIMMANPVRK